MSTNSTITAASSVRTLEDLQNASKTTSGKSLGQDDFLKILVAQMSNQDPMEPTGNGEFLAQMAQFTMLEQIQEMSANFSASQSYSMIGKYVYVQQADSVVFGKVDGVITEDGVNYLLINGETYDASAVTGVMDESAVDSKEEQLLQSANLIGCTITADVTAEDGTVTTVTGQVSKIIVQDGTIYAVVDEQNIPVSDIKEIA